jgi:glycosyltransferase involved in cell wall biosynthesis
MKYSKDYPRWSVMIPSYNCARFLEQALLSVLQQDFGEEFMQIEVVDDCSTKDDPEAVVNRIGGGRVSFYKHPENVGAIMNFNTCVARAKGEFVHILHGDDWVLDKFYETVLKSFETYPDLGIVIAGCSDFDENSRLLNTPAEIASLILPSKNIDSFLYSNPIRPPGVVIRKTVYDAIGKFDEALIHCADWDMWVRAISNFSGLYIPQNLASYRIFPGNDTSKLTLSGENIRDYQRLFIKFKQAGYGIDEKEFSIVLRNTFLNQYRNFMALKLKKSVALYKKEMPRYFTDAEISQLRKETFVLTIKTAGVKLLLPFKKSKSFLFRAIARLKRSITLSVRH